ncbi:hypothetical protein [Haloactinomyces albus]|uniref:Methionine synthase II (Cobalamin-independent) n=1 Tax=Haloactinomyces albus TaxID=1352928 RepID=A0AAE3ZA67_9ACTN|nr:hypothetical protein [Haloactinomyces albus]MDR7301176.1 methionine synthase II (cobalamin-independent) [Haloactinomyces albus]
MLSRAIEVGKRNPEGVEKLLRATLESVPAERLWGNPDCGLKTRDHAEIDFALRNMVTSAIRMRNSLQ